MRVRFLQPGSVVIHYEWDSSPRQLVKLDYILRLLRSKFLTAQEKRNAYRKCQSNLNATEASQVVRVINVDTNNALQKPHAFLRLIYACPLCFAVRSDNLGRWS